MQSHPNSIDQEYSRMPGKYSTMTHEELIEANAALDEKRNESVSKIKGEQLKIQDEFDKRAVETQFNNLTDAEKAALRKLALEHEDDGE